MIKFIEVAKFYLGCDVVLNGKVYPAEGITATQIYLGQGAKMHNIGFEGWVDIADVKPLLIPLRKLPLKVIDGWAERIHSSQTKAIELFEAGSMVPPFFIHAESSVFLLQNRADIYSLIENGQAIDLNSVQIVPEDEEGTVNSIKAIENND